MQNHCPHELIFIDETGFVSRRNQNCFHKEALLWLLIYVFVGADLFIGQMLIKEIRLFSERAAG